MSKRTYVRTQFLTRLSTRVSRSWKKKESMRGDGREMLSRAAQSL
jgi:hypothetical protein